MQARPRWGVIALAAVLVVAGIWCAQAAYAHDPDRIAVAGLAFLCVFSGTDPSKLQVPSFETSLPSSRVSRTPDAFLPP